MNLYPFRFFIPSSWWGKSYHFIRWLKKQKPFYWTHFDIVIPDIKADKTIICFAQIHTILRGRLTGFTAKRIAKVQARLFTFYSFLVSKNLAQSFGVEGLTDKIGGNIRFDTDSLNKYLSDQEKELLRKNGKDFTAVKKIFLRLAKAWHVILSNHPDNEDRVASIASLIHGIRMLSFLDPAITIYPIEGEKEYQFVAKKIDELHNVMFHIERDPNFIRAKGKGFKKLTQNEYDAVIKMNTAVKEFNRVISAPLREEAHISLALRKLENTEITAFVMGVGHRQNLLQAAKKLLKGTNTAFLFVIPWELWLWQSIICWFWYGVFMMFMAIIVWLWIQYLL